MRWSTISFLFCFGCTRLAFQVDKTFPPTDVHEIQRAADEWNKITTDQITFDGTDWRIIEEDPKSGFNGQQTGRVIRIAREPKNATTFDVALHEFGHAHRLKHLCALDAVEAEKLGKAVCTDVPLGVMDPRHVVSHFTDADRLECRRVKACK